ncbi:unnamed protein product [Chironomus riparius]|uniref:Uncharacterized protein n=1 Tax=Chironomus riparius TaxID=315576 RepID=A0A9N9WR47_9DIPT|nr:unnamed protein product [Chironomus riparius]
MKVLIITSLVLFVISAAYSAQPSRRNDKNSNLAVMLAYRPKSEIQTKDNNNKSWNYRITDDKNASTEEALNKKLMDLLTKENLAKYLSDFNDKETRNNKRSTVSSCSSSFESTESIDDAKIVEINKQKEDKKSCYKDTYKNVLNAFEEALRSQIQDYKKCVCQKKHKTTTTTTTSTTTEAPQESDEDLNGADGRAFEDSPILIGNDTEIASAIDHPEDIICFHKQYAFMLKKLLDRIPCKAPQLSSPSSLEEFNNEAGNKRNERHNVQSNESESIELDVSKITQKPTTKENNKLNREKIDSEDDLKELILGVLKEHLKLKEEKVIKKITTTTPITIEESDEDVDNHEKFIEKLKQLFQDLESEENSFPVRQNKFNDDSTASMSSRKFTKKSNVKPAIFDQSDELRKHKQSKSRKNLTNEIPRRSTVSEDSDESTETSFKVKNSKFEKQYLKAKEYLREQDKSSSKLSTVSDDKSRKSYRTSARSGDNETNHNSYEEHATKETPKKSKNSSTLNDDRLANDLAKAISDLARKYIKS